MSDDPKCKYCGAECVHADIATADQPCWGEIMVEIDDPDIGQVHVCRGHQWIWSYLYYKQYVAEGEEWPLRCVRLPRAVDPTATITINLSEINDEQEKAATEETPSILEAKI